MTLHAITIKPRSLSNIIADLREAKANVADACADIERGEDADDRCTEAETRFEDLRAEFDVRLAEVTGLSVEQLREAYAEAVI